VTDAYVDGFTEVEAPAPALVRSPLDQVLGDRADARWIGCAAAVGIHALIASAALLLAASARPFVSDGAVPVTQMFEVMLEVAPEPPALVAPLQEPEPSTRQALALAERAPRRAAPSPAPVAAARVAAAPAAAAAARLLTHEPPAEDVVDFGETFVQGAAAAHAGGITQAGGISERAARDSRARAGGVAGGTGTDTSGVDRSRLPALAGGAKWDCPFPREAEFAAVDTALVTLRVRVSRLGSVEEVAVERDPGNGFGREAQRCALNKRWAPGLDSAGNAVDMTSLVRVRFLRAD
jgi:periplasmic protein TonB